MIVTPGQRDRLRAISEFSELVAYLHDELDWPVGDSDFEDLTYDYTPEELGIDEANAAKIQEIKRLRPLSGDQPWGIFFVSFEPKRLPVVALRRILASVAIRKRASANPADRVGWNPDDLLFISAFGQGDERQISFAHFSNPTDARGLPTLKVLGWDARDTGLHLDGVAEALVAHLCWPSDETDLTGWRDNWRQAFTLRHRETIQTAEDLSVRLAALARRLNSRVTELLEMETVDGPLSQLMEVFRKALVHDLTRADFADMFAQTIAYGLLAARITTYARTGEGVASGLPATTPFLSELIETFMGDGGEARGAAPAGLDFDEIGLEDVRQLIDDARMDSVLADFGDRNPREDPVIHFYEHFLAQYDPRRRADRGVFYTPRPVVRYIVCSVDEQLRSRYGLDDGLADTSTWREVMARVPGLAVPEGTDPSEPFVQILDPATGTGTFLVEVIDHVYRTMIAKWDAAGRADESADLWQEYVSTSLLPRVVGYELMAAPYVIAHVKIGLKLVETGYRFHEQDRVSVYLTNALEPPEDRAQQLDIGLPALAHEAEAVNEVKQGRRFTVVLGNPPYAGHSRNNSISWIVDLVRDYYRDDPTLCGPGQSKWLQDDYVKFMRLSQYILDRSGAGVFSMITNHRYLTNRTFREMRRKWAESFSNISVLDLHGNSVVAEVSPVPRDENVFDIEQGVAIQVALWSAGAATEVNVAELWGPREGENGEGKYDFLETHSLDSTEFASVDLAQPLFLYSANTHESVAGQDEWDSLTRLPDLMPGALGPNGKPPSGLATMHDRLAIAFSRSELEDNVERLLATSSREEAVRVFGGLCNPGQWDYQRAIQRLESIDWRSLITPIHFAPFDVRYTLFDNSVAVHLRHRISDHLFQESNLALVVGEAGQEISGAEWDAVSCVDGLLQLNYFRRNGSPTLPLYLYEDTLLGHSRRPNLDPRAIAPLATIYEGPADEFGLPASVEPEDVLHYMYAVLCSPTYRDRYAGYLRTEFPRIPWPRSSVLFGRLCEIGDELMGLHLMNANRAPNAVSYVGEPGPVEKVTYAGNTVFVDQAKTRGFAPVCPEVWHFHVGGYRVCEKWLKDRKGRELDPDAIGHYCAVVAAVGETLRLMAEIDEVIAAAGEWQDVFQLGTANSGL